MHQYTSTDTPLKGALTSSRAQKSFSLPFQRRANRRRSEVLPKDLTFLNDYLLSEYANEDEHETEEYFISNFVDEIICALFAILSIGSGIIYYECRVCETECEEFESERRLAERTSLIFCSLGVLFFIIVLIQKYYHLYRLYIIAKYISIRDSFWKSNLWVGFVIEALVALIHPNLIFNKYNVTTGKGWNIITVEYNVNDFLLVVMIFRLWYIVKIVVISTKYYSARVDRICKMMVNFIFSVKCVMINNTAIFLLFLTLTICFGFSYMMKVIEGPAYLLNSKDTLNNFNLFFITKHILTVYGKFNKLMIYFLCIIVNK